MKFKNKKDNLSLPNTKHSLNSKLKSADGENDFYENIVNTVREPLLILDKDLRVVKANQSFFDFFKVIPDETVGTLIYNLGNNQWDIPKLRELLETILPEKTIFNGFEVEHIFSTIGKQFMLLNARQIERAFGKEKVILLAIEDITRRKREEKSLREKNQLTSEYLDILVDRARSPIIIWDSSLVINRFNLEFEKLSGYEWSEMIGKPIKTLFPDDRADSFIDLLKNHLSDKNSEAFEIDILTKDKNIKTVLWNSTGIFDKEDGNIIATIAQDITERKQTTDELTSLESRYRRLFESAQDGILILDAETGKIIDANPFLCELFDYSKEKFIDKELWQIGFFKDIAANKEKFLELQRNGYVRYEDLQLETTDGRKLNVEFVSNIYLVNNQKVIQCNIRDNTVRKNYQKQLKESEEKFRTIVERSADAIFITDNQGKYQYVNIKAVQMLGYSKEEMMHFTIADISPKNKAAEYFQLFKRLLKDGFALAEIDLVKKDGNLIPVDFNAVLLPNGFVYASCRDISERIDIQKEIKFQSDLLYNVGQSVIATDLQGNVIYWNNEAEKIYGWTSEEAMGQSIVDLTPAQQTQGQAIEIMKELSKGNTWSGEFFVKRKDGTSFPALVTDAPITDSDGKLIGIIGISSDITERKQVAEELITAKEKAEKSDKMKSEFLAQMSHEIRTPINVVLGYTEYLDDLFGEPKVPEVVDCFNGINLSSNRIIRTIDLLLNAAELKTHSYQVNFVTIDLDKEILNKLFKEFQFSAKQRGLELIYNSEVSETEIFVDDYSTTQIFVNLIDNAIKYTKTGKVEILLSKNITGNIIVEIKDTGIGIAKEFLPRLFDFFAQEEQGYTRSFEGNGLGLALVKSYCEINYALLEVESEKNVGTTFRVIFDKKFTVNTN